MPIAILIPLLPVDAQDVNKPYQQTEQTHIEQKPTGLASGQAQHNQFTVVDAVTDQPLTANACFFFTKSGRRQCIDGADNRPVSIDFPEVDIVAIEVSAAGYQSYQGNLIVDKLDSRQQRHTIRLTRELTVLSVWLDAVGYQCELRPPGTEPAIPFMPVPGQPTSVAAYSVQPRPYTLVISDRSRTVRVQQPITLIPGLNAVRVDLPKPAVPPSTELFNPDSLPPIYFEQSSFTLRSDSKAVLVQTAVYLAQHPTLRLHLTGHTDAEGDERLNRALSENRAKVASSFLFSQGISDNRMVLSGCGSRYPAAPNDKEDNKARNRRVQMKFVNH